MSYIDLALLLHGALALALLKYPTKNKHCNDAKAIDETL